MSVEQKKIHLPLQLFALAREVHHDRPDKVIGKWVLPQKVEVQGRMRRTPYQQVGWYEMTAGELAATIDVLFMMLSEKQLVLFRDLMLEMHEGEASGRHPKQLELLREAQIAANERVLAMLESVNEGKDSPR